MKKQLLAIFIVIVMLLSHTTIFANTIVMDANYENDTTVSAKEDKAEFESSFCCSSDASNDDSLLLDCDQEFLNANQTNTISFILKTEKEVKEITNEGSGFNILSYSFEGDLIYVEISYSSEYSKPQLSISVLLDDNSILSANMYGYYYENKLFVSGASKDDAFEKYCLYLLNSQEISESQYKAMRNSYYAQSVTITTSTEMQLSTSQIQGSADIQSSGSTTYLRGTLVWVDDRGVEHPCQYIKVNVYDKEDVIADQLITTTYTNAGGFYSISFENDQSFFEFGNDLFIEIFAEGESVALKNNSGVTYSVSTRDSTLSNVANGSTSNISVKFEMSENGNFVGGDLGRAMQISQPAIVASRYAKAMNGSAMPDVDVYYPINDINCGYDPDLNRIYIIHQSAATNYPASYASWDVIMHEYGHHVQCQLDITENPGVKHNSFENDIDINSFTDEERKEKGTKLAWAESWPTVFGIIAQKYYINELTNIVTVGDVSYTSYNSADYSIEYGQFCLGEGCERAIMYFLYNLYDSDNDDIDTVALGHQFWWDVSDASNAKTFSAFIDYVCYLDILTIDQLGKLLSYSGMAVSNLRMSSGSLPSFIWDGYGGSEYHPYNSNVIVFAKPSDQEIFRTNAVSRNRYQLKNEEWGTLLASGYTTIKWRVISREISDFSTGPYSTAWHTFNIPDFTALSLNENINDVVSVGEYNLYNFTAEESGTYKFYTEGDTDTVGELYSLFPYDGSTTGRLIYNDNGHTDSQGNSTNMGITYELEAGQTVYLKVYTYIGNLRQYEICVDRIT